MTEPINTRVGCLLLYLAQNKSRYHNVAQFPHLIEAVAHADSLDPCPIRHAGKVGSMDGTYLCLTGFGEQIVEEMITAARAVTHDQTQSCG
jgi:hypothetical protein